LGWYRVFPPGSGTPCITLLRSTASPTCWRGTPDLEAGNILAKQLSYFAGADSAGIVMGARCPIALTSRADPVEKAASLLPRCWR
jgi:hypothetical protein